jgi:hypothetical protein
VDENSNDVFVIVDVTGQRVTACTVDGTEVPAVITWTYADGTRVNDRVGDRYTMTLAEAER